MQKYFLQTVGLSGRLKRDCKSTFESIRAWVSSQGEGVEAMLLLQWSSDLNRSGNPTTLTLLSLNCEIIFILVGNKNIFRCACKVFIDVPDSDSCSSMWHDNQTGGTMDQETEDAEQTIHD